MTVVERVRELVEPLLSARDLDLYDVEMAGPVLRVVVDRPGPLDLDALGDATRAVSRALDEADPIGSTYTLEVTSPGLERTLRTPSHFERAVGEQVKIKQGEGGEAGERRLAYDDIERARTVFVWGPSERPGGRRSREKRDHRS
jgi:ribosome maturation factor RimP